MQMLGPFTNKTYALTVTFAENGLAPELILPPCPLLLSQVWNVRSAHHLCRAPSWTGEGSAPFSGCRWTSRPAATPRMRVQCRTSSHQGEPCLLRSSDLRGRESSGATPCARCATSSSTQPHRPRSTTTASPTRRGSSRSAKARCQVTQVGPERGFGGCKIRYKRWALDKKSSVAGFWTPV